MFLPPRLSYRMLVIFWNLLCAWGWQRWLPEQNQDAIIRRRRNQWIPDKRQQEMAITDLPLPLSTLSFSHVPASHSYWLKSFNPQISSNRALILETLSKSPNPPISWPYFQSPSPLFPVQLPFPMATPSHYDTWNCSCSEMMPSDIIFSCLTLLSVSNNWLHLFSDLICIHLPALDSVAHLVTWSCHCPWLNRFALLLHRTQIIPFVYVCCLHLGCKGLLRIPANVKPQLPTTDGTSVVPGTPFFPQWARVLYCGRSEAFLCSLHPPPVLLLMVSFSSLE